MIRSLTKFGRVTGIGEVPALAPAQIRLGRICGLLRAPSGALGDGAKAELRVVLWLVCIGIF